MSVALDIIRSYRTPREVVRRRIGIAVREDRALAILMGACALIFVAQWPRLARETFFDDSIALDARMAGALFGWVLIAPLAFYVFAYLIYAVQRVIGGGGTAYEARMAVFWSLLAASPLWLLSGLMSGLVGPSTGTSLVAAIALGAFVFFVVAGTREIFHGRQAGAM